MELLCIMAFHLAIATTMLHGTASSYTPVVFMHGMFGSTSDGTQILAWINQSHPGTRLYNIDMYNNMSSLVSLPEQVAKIGKKVEAISRREPGGFHLIGFSQGGIIGRGILQAFTLNVDTFISLGAPLAGEFGRSLLKNFVPPSAVEVFYKFAYTKSAQEISVCNYWNDPHQQTLYRKYSRFLAVYNNDTYNPRSEEFKSNFLRLKKLVLVGGPGDDVVTPWQSSQFGFYDANETVQGMHTQKFYQADSFGLRTLDKRGAVYTRTIEGFTHHEYRTSYTVFKEVILPYLT